MTSRPEENETAAKKRKELRVTENDRSSDRSQKRSKKHCATPAAGDSSKTHFVALLRDNVSEKQLKSLTKEKLDIEQAAAFLSEAYSHTMFCILQKHVEDKSPGSLVVIEGVGLFHPDPSTFTFLVFEARRQSDGRLLLPTLRASFDRDGKEIVCSERKKLGLWTEAEVAILFLALKDMMADTKATEQKGYETAEDIRQLIVQKLLVFKNQRQSHMKHPSPEFMSLPATSILKRLLEWKSAREICPPNVRPSFYTQGSIDTHVCQEEGEEKSKHDREKEKLRGRVKSYRRKQTDEYTKLVKAHFQRWKTSLRQIDAAQVTTLECAKSMFDLGRSFVIAEWELDQIQRRDIKRWVHDLMEEGIGEIWKCHDIDLDDLYPFKIEDSSPSPDAEKYVSKNPDGIGDSVETLLCGWVVDDIGLRRIVAETGSSISNSRSFDDAVSLIDTAEKRVDEWVCSQASLTESRVRAYAEFCYEDHNASDTEEKQTIGKSKPRLVTKLWNEEEAEAHFLLSGVEVGSNCVQGGIEMLVDHVGMRRSLKKILEENRHVSYSIERELRACLNTAKRFLRKKDRNNARLCVYSAVGFLCSKVTGQRIFSCDSDTAATICFLRQKKAAFDEAAATIALLYFELEQVEGGVKEMPADAWWHFTALQSGEMSLPFEHCDHELDDDMDIDLRLHEHIAAAYLTRTVGVTQFCRES